MANNPHAFAKEALKYYGFDSLRRSRGESDYEYFKRILRNEKLGFLERHPEESLRYLILYKEPTLHMIAYNQTVQTASLDFLRRELRSFEFQDGKLISYS